MGELYEISNEYFYLFDIFQKWQKPFSNDILIWIKTTKLQILQ